MPSPMRLSLGQRLEVEVRTGKEADAHGEVLFLFLDFKTDFGPLRLSASTRAETLRAAILWLRSNYGNLAYNFVTGQKSLADLLPDR